MQQRTALYIGTAHVGSALPSDIALCPALAHCRVEPWGLVLPTLSADCNTVLAQWAQALHQAGRLKAWRDELLSVSALPPQGAALLDLPMELARLERGAARVLGILTHAVHLVGLTPDGQIWVQQRAMHKATDPGMWDTLAGGLLAAGDSLHSGVLRETYEEAGIASSDLLDLHACGMVQQSRSVADGHILEAVWTYTATVRTGVLPHNLDGEAMGFACISGSDLAQRVAAGLVTQEAVIAFRMAGV